jgi:uncharacterized protein (TIGR03435 family)
MPSCGLAKWARDEHNADRVHVVARRRVIQCEVAPLRNFAAILPLALASALAQSASPLTFDVAYVKALPQEPHGGDFKVTPTSVSFDGYPLGFMIRWAYGLHPYQAFETVGPAWLEPGLGCVRFDVIGKVDHPVPVEQLRLMLRTLLAERLKLKFHYEQKEMAIFELTVGKKGLKMKESAPDAASNPEEYPWVIPEISVGKDGCPVFPAGRGGRTEGRAGCNRWTGFNLSMLDIVKTLSFNLGRKVVDATGLKGKYDIDVRWYIDAAWLLEGRADLRDLIGELPDEGSHGPTLIRAVRDQLGLELIPKKGTGDIVVVDHFEKVPIEN